MNKSIHSGVSFRIVAAVFLIALGILWNPFSFARLFRPLCGDSLEPANFSVVAFVSILLIANGCLLAVLGTTPAKRRKLLFVNMTLLLMLILIEVGLQAISLAINLFRPTPTYFETRADHLVFSSLECGPDLLKEFDAVSMDFVPFLTWATNEFHGTYVNVSGEGVRKTWNPAFRDRTPIRIYTFGGSAMWGAGVSDEGTIASCLSRRLNANDAVYEITNYGEGAYTFLQEVVRFLLLLREGHRPDFAIFYSGVNDVYAGYQSGRPALIQNENMIRRQLHNKGLRKGSAAIGTRLQTAMDRLILYRCVKRLTSPHRQYSEPAFRYSDAELAGLAKGVGESYLKSYRLLENMANVYQIPFVCFWQPAGFLEERLYEEESASSVRYQDYRCKTLFLQTREWMREHAPARFVDLSDVLKDRTMPYYFDWCHISQEGNEVVARKIAEVLRSNELREKPGREK